MQIGLEGVNVATAKVLAQLLHLFQLYCVDLEHLDALLHLSGGVNAHMTASANECSDAAHNREGL